MEISGAGTLAPVKAEASDLRPRTYPTSASITLNFRDSLNKAEEAVGVVEAEAVAVEVEEAAAITHSGSTGIHRC